MACPFHGLFVVAGVQKEKELLYQTLTRELKKQADQQTVPHHNRTHTPRIATATRSQRTGRTQLTNLRKL